MENKFRKGDVVEVVAIRKDDGFYADRRHFIGRVFVIIEPQYCEAGYYGGFFKLVDGSGIDLYNKLKCKNYYSREREIFNLGAVRLEHAFGQPELPPDFKPNSLTRRP